jgi:hypothetical protein
MRFAGCLALLLLAEGCAEPVVPIDGAKPEVRIVRAAWGGFQVKLFGMPESPRALEVEILIESDDAYVMEDAAPPSGVPLDAVRIEMRGTNRAILFSGDKHGGRIHRSGVAAEFRVRPPEGGTAGSGKIRIGRALVVANDGTPIDVTNGSAISIR